MMSKFQMLLVSKKIWNSLAQNVLGFMRWYTRHYLFNGISEGCPHAQANTLACMRHAVTVYTGIEALDSAH